MSHELAGAYVLDSFALLAFLSGEVGMLQVQVVLRGRAKVVLSIINLGEVLYITERQRGLPVAQHVLAVVEQLPIELVEATRSRVLAAAHIKASFRLSYADAFVIAAAQEFGATVLTGDPEFEAPAAAGVIHVEWLAAAPS